MKNNTLGRLIFMCLLLAGFALSAHAANMIVNNTGDPDDTLGACVTGGSCSLRQAINAASSGSAVTFNIPPSSCLDGVCTIKLVLGGLQIKKNLIIFGPGTKNLVITQAPGSVPPGFTMFTIPADQGQLITVKFADLTISDGVAMSGSGGISAVGFSDVTLDGVVVQGCGSGFAGGIVNGGTMTILNSTISGNSGQFAGGIHNTGILTIANSTISGNQSSGGGAAGGIVNGESEDEDFPITLNMNNVSVINNTATGGSTDVTGGVLNLGLTNIRNTVIAENHSPSTSSPDALGTFMSQGSNFVGIALPNSGFGVFGKGDIIGGDSSILILGDYGGGTKTHGLLSVSPLIDRGQNCVVTRTCTVNNPPVALTFDQRKYPANRNSGNAVDIGAYEFQTPIALASGTVIGRVYSNSGGGMAYARIKVTINGNVSTTITNPFGYFRIDNLPIGQTATVETEVKGVPYGSQGVQVTDVTPDLHIYPTP